MPPQAPPIRPPTQQRPGAVPGQPTGPEFKDIATEKLLLKPLSDGKVAAHFEFDYLNKNGVPRDPRTLGNKDKGQHYEFFPMTMGQILREYAVAEMHLTLNTGRWNYDAWGYPENPAVASGAELWVWMADGGLVSVEERWIGLSNALAGLFCASLSFLPQSRTTSPFYSFLPEGQLPLYPLHSTTTPNATSGLPYKLYHAILPSENICTENLTPFIKMLPCKSYAGIAELLNPHKLFDGYWYGIGIHATWHDGLQEEARGIEESVAKPTETMVKGEMPSNIKWMQPEGSINGEKPPLKSQNPLPKAGIKLQLTVGTVLDPLAHHRSPKPEKREWTLENLFGKNVTRMCAVTNRADVRILGPHSLDNITPNPKLEQENSRMQDGFSIQPPSEAKFRVKGIWNSANTRTPPHSLDMETREEVWEVVRVKKDGLNLTVTENGVNYRGNRLRDSESPISLARSLRGSDQTRGGFVLSITNRLPVDINSWYMESVPWVLRPYLSSLRIEEVQPLTSSPNPVEAHSQSVIGSQISTSDILDLSRVRYVPPSLLSTAKDTRQMPTLLEMPLNLPAHSIVRVSFAFEKMFLKYTEHPPDAQRGWDLPGGVLILVDQGLNDTQVDGISSFYGGRMSRMYTAPLLADLATPDFSMPYNVIILTGSLIALLFGMVFNMLTRRFVLVRA